MAPVDIVVLTQRLLAARGVESERVAHDLHLRALELVCSPRVVSVQPATGTNGIHTMSIVRVKHARAFPTPIFEYQHGLGNSADEALETALEGWMQLDLPVLADATRAVPEHCPTIKYGPIKRRVLLGPPERRCAKELSEAETGAEHPFCPCCLTMSCFKAFRPLIERDGTFGVRLYAARSDGEVMADCRVNGEDFQEGKSALMAYAASWAGSAFDARKQYVVMQPDPGA